MPLVQIIGMTPTNTNFLVAYAIVADETEGSYSWVLGQLRVILGNDVEPNVIVSDRELGLLKPIEYHFPRSTHLLCTWLIFKDVENRVYHLTNKSKKFAATCTHGHWKKVVDSESVEEFGKNWNLLTLYWDRVNRKIVEYLERTWLVHKEKFICCYTNEFTHLGNTTNCRVESAHKALKDWMQTSNNALDTIFSTIDSVIQGQVGKTR